jgi:hypothetical protein
MTTSLPMRGSTKRWWGRAAQRCGGGGSGRGCSGFVGIDDESPAVRADVAASLRAATRVAGVVWR